MIAASKKSPPEKFIDWLKSQYDRAVIIELIDEDRWVMVDRLMFHYTIKWGMVGDFANGYEDRWCIRDLDRALTSFNEWKNRGFEGEPTLWHRHPSTGRRRNQDNPDPSTQYIEP